MCKGLIIIDLFFRNGISGSYRSELKAIIQKTGYDYNIDIVELEIPVDHIHMIVRPEKTSPSKVMQMIRSIFAREFFNLRLPKM